MKVYKKILGTFPLALLLFTACDDNTSTLGIEAMPEGDFTENRQRNYAINDFTSIKADSILARSTKAYLGKFTDPFSHTTFESDFLSQFYCPENFEFRDLTYMYKENAAGEPILPEDFEKLDDDARKAYRTKAKSIELSLYYSSYFGDSLNTNKLAVYELSREADKLLDPKKSYYTNLDPNDFINADDKNSLLAEHSYTAVDQINGDSLFQSNGYHMLNVQLPTSLGDRIIQSFYDHKEYYSNSTEFIKNVLAGVYVKNVQAEGTVLNIDLIHLNVYFEYYEKRKTTNKVDSLVTYFTQFIATPEVIQQNRFQQTGGLDQYVGQPNTAYIQTPAGIFPTLKLPVEDIVADMESKETINSAMLTINRRNNLNDFPFQMGTPQEILMIRRADLTSFFEEQKVPDYETSYTSYFTNNKYTFNNVTALINYLKTMDEEQKKEEADKGIAWNEVVLIPITEVTQSAGNNTVTVVRVLHDLSMNFAELKADDVELRIIYSKYKDGQN